MYFLNEDVILLIEVVETWKIVNIQKETINEDSIM